MKIEIIPCIKCGKKIEAIELELQTKPEAGMWHKGIVDNIAANYGSEYDGGLFLIGICDNCIKDAIKNVEVVENGNYMVWK